MSRGRTLTALPALAIAVGLALAGGSGCRPFVRIVTPRKSAAQTPVQSSESAPVPRDVDDALTQLASGKSLARIAAADWFRDHPDGQDRVVVGLTGALTDTDPNVRIHAAGALEKLGPAGASAFGALASAVWDDYPDVSAAIAAAICAIGPVPGDDMVRLRGAREQTQDPDTRDKATVVLGLLGDGGACPDVVRIVDNRESPVWRTVGVVALRKAGPDDPIAVRAVGRRLVDPDGYVRVDAAFALGYMVPRSASEVPALTAALSDERAGVRQGAAWALGRIGETTETANQAARQAQDALATVVRDDTDAYARIWAARALGGIGADSEQALSALCGAVEQAEEPALRAYAIEALGFDGVPDPRALLVLTSVLGSDPDPVARGRAARALAALGSDAGAGELRRNLEDPDPHCRASALQGLAYLGSLACASPELLGRARADADEQVRTWAAIASGLCGPSFDKGELASALASKDEYVRVWAARALASRGDPKGEAALHEAMGSSFRKVRADAAAGLKALPWRMVR